MRQSLAFFRIFSPQGGWIGFILKGARVLDNFKSPTYRDVTCLRAHHFHFLSFGKAKAWQKCAKILRFSVFLAQVAAAMASF